MNESQPNVGQEGIQLAERVEQLRLEKEGIQRAVHVEQLRAALLTRMSGAEVMDAIYDFAQQLQKRYRKDYADHRVYHALIGSTPPRGQKLKEGDFPGEDSVVEFLEKLGKVTHE